MPQLAAQVAYGRFLTNTEINDVWPTAWGFTCSWMWGEAVGCASIYVSLTSLESLLRYSKWNFRRKI